MRGLRTALAAALALCGALPASGRPYALADLLHLSAYRAAYPSPDGRHVVLQVAAPRDQARSFENETATDLSLQRLYLADLNREGPAVPLLGEARTGIVAGPFAPSGRRMIVYRFRRRRLEAGLLTLATGRVRWLGLEVLPATLGQTLQWTSETCFLALLQLPSFEVERLSGGAPTHSDLVRLWRATARGHVPGITEVGSGRFAGRTLPPTSRLVEVDVGSGRVRRMITGRFDDLEAAPSGRAVALAGWEEDAPLSPHASLGFSDLNPRRRLTLVDLVSRRVHHPCPDCDLIMTVLDWSPDSRSLLVFARRPQHEDWADGELLRVDALEHVEPAMPTGLRVSLQHFGSEQLPEVFAGWWDGAPLVYAHAAADPARSDWWSLRREGASALTRTLTAVAPEPAAPFSHNLIVSAAGVLTAVDREGRDAPLFRFPATLLRELRPGAGVRRQLMPFGGEPSVAVASAGSPSRAWKMSGSRTSFALEPDIESLAPAGEGLVGVQTDAHGAAQVIIVDPQRRRTLLRLNRFLDDVDPARIWESHHLGPDGAVLKDWLFLPATPGRAPVPVVVLPYPGFTYQDVPRAYRPDYPLPYANAQLIAAAGFAALVPSLPPVDPTHGPAAGLAEAIGSAIDGLKGRSEVDLRRVAIWGHSFGGYTALIAAEADPRYRAVIAGAGPTDLVSLRGVFPQESRATRENVRRRESWMGWSEEGQAQLHGPLWTAPQRYIDASPVAHADRITAPVLLFYGDQDFVGLEQGEEMFSALKRLDKDALMLSFWGEDHLISSPANLKVYYDTSLHFLRDALSGGDPRSPSVPRPSTPESTPLPQ